MNLKNIPSEVTWAWVVQNTQQYVGEYTYDKIVEIIKKYPEYFPWETKYNSLPKEVHEAYKKEKYPYIYDSIICTGGISAQMKEAELKDYNDYSKKTLKEVGEDFIKLDKEARIKEKERYNKDKALWDKHYKKYNLEYRE